MSENGCDMTLVYSDQPADPLGWVRFDDDPCWRIGHVFLFAGEPDMAHEVIGVDGDGRYTIRTHFRQLNPQFKKGAKG